MGIDPSDTASVQTLIFYQLQDLMMMSQSRLWQGAEQAQNLLSVRQRAAGKLSDDECVHYHLILIKKRLEPNVAFSKMVDWMTTTSVRRAPGAALREEFGLFRLPRITRVAQKFLYIRATTTLT
jgi:hypothetical protein